jgi:calcineurin-like phosphoesterase family protein
MKLTSLEISNIAAKHLMTTACNDVARLICHISELESELGLLREMNLQDVDVTPTVIDVESYEWITVQDCVLVNRWWGDGDLWIWSDLHLGHKNVLRYEPTRRCICDTLEEMNSALISHWNDMVQPNDYALNLGDVSLSSSEQTKLQVNNMHGRKRLVMGNHDRGHSVTWWRKLFTEVYAAPILVDAAPSNEVPLLVIFSHEPVSPEYMTRFGADLNIHGHMHSKRLNSDRHICVSVEQTAWLPIQMSALLSRRRT